jgi:hypothetical protein
MADKRKEKSTGGNSDYKARQASKQRSSIVNTFIFVILLGVVVGLGIVYKDQLLAMLNKKEPELAAPPPKPAAEPPAKLEKAKEVVAPLAKPAAPPEAKAAVVDKVDATNARGADDDLAKNLLTQGRTLLEKFEFDKGAAVFKEAAQKKVGADLKAEALTWEKKAAAFQLATKHIPVSDFAIGDNAFALETTDGREMVGLIKNESDGMINFQMVLNPVSPGKAILPLPAADIKKKAPLSLKQRRDDFLELLGGLESGMTVSRSTDYYDVVFIAKRLGLGKECIEYLNRAYTGGPGHDADPYLADSFRKEVIRRTIDKCSLMLAGGRAKRFAEDELNKLLKTFPSYAVAQDEVDAFRMNIMSKIASDFKSTIKISDAKPKVAVTAPKKGQAPVQSAREIANEDQMEFVVENGGVQGKGSAGPIVDQANSKYDEGMKVYRSYRQGTNGSNNKVLETAMHLLETAVDLYDKALKADPSNKAVMDRQTEANMIVYACKKYHTL